MRSGESLNLRRNRQAFNIRELRRQARRRLPRPVFDLIEEGSGDEVTLRANERAWDGVRFRPRSFVDVASRDSSVSVFGQRISMPLMLAPTGAGRVTHPGAEIAVARAAARANTIYVQSTVTSYSLEDVARSTAAPLWFQLYLPSDRDVASNVIERVQRAGYKVLMLTVDTPVFGNRERSIRNRVTIPFRVSPSLIAHGALRPRWSAQFLVSTISTRFGDGPARRLSLRGTEATILSALSAVSWDDLAFVRSAWKGPLVVKGVMRPDECDVMVDHGVDGIVVSNHGGRQLDGSPGTLEVLPAVVDAVRGRVDVFIDGGIRRGAHVLKAMALGAKGCFVGRPYLYGLAVGGEHGVLTALEILRREIDEGMALLGCRTIQDIDADLVSTPAVGSDMAAGQREEVRP